MRLSRPPEAVATQDVNEFWVVLLMAAKYIARLSWKTEWRVLRWVPELLRPVEQFVGQPTPLLQAAQPIRPLLTN